MRLLFRSWKAGLRDRYGIAAQQALSCNPTGLRCFVWQRHWPEGPEHDAPTQWQPDRSVVSNPWPHPPILTAIGRGLLGRCPACGKTHIFNGFLRVVDACTNCGAPLGLARADDAPPYFTILITGHIVVPLMFIVDRMGEPPIWVMSAIFLPLTFFMALGRCARSRAGRWV